jgi:hypothetical protein
MPYISIIGVKIEYEELPIDLHNIIFSNTYKNFMNDSVIDDLNWSHLTLSPKYHERKREILNSKLKIYRINYKNIELDIYVNAYRSYLQPNFYIIYESHRDHEYIFDDYRYNSDYDEFLNILKKLSINYKNNGIFLLEE